MAYPSTILANTNPSGTSLTTSPSHSAQHTTVNNDLTAVENVLGTTAGTSVLKNFALGDFATRINSGGTLQQILLGTVNNSTLGTPSVTGGTINNSTIGTPAITGGTISTPTITKPLMDATNPTAQTYTPGVAGTATLDLSLANEHRITMPAGNITIALSNDTNAQKFIVSTLQDGVGSRTVTWFTTIRWAGGVAPTLTTTASKRDTFGFIRTGSGTYDGFVVGQNL